MTPVEMAGAAIRRGDLVVVPTETVYGLAADATNAGAVAKIFALKGRPATNPLIVHVDTTAMMQTVAGGVPEAAWPLVAAFWPGPLTLVLPRGDLVPDIVTAGGGTVAVRMPNHHLALALIAESGKPLAAPSANLSERLSPTRAEDVSPEIRAGVAAVLDGGPCRVGIESTVLDITVSPPSILRPGGVSAGAIEKVLGRALGVSAAKGRSPGEMSRHYSPRTLVRFVQFGEPADVPIAGRDPAEYAAALYAELATLDREGRSEIVVEYPPAGPEWAAVRDRHSRMIG